MSKKTVPQPSSSKPAAKSLRDGKKKKMDLFGKAIAAKETTWQKELEAIKTCADGQTVNAAAKAAKIAYKHKKLAMSFNPSTSLSHSSGPSNQPSSSYHYYAPDPASAASNPTASSDDGEYSQLVPSVYTQSREASLAFSSSSISWLSTHDGQLSLSSSGFPKGFDAQK